MSLELRPCTPADLGALRALLSGPDLAPQFDKFQGAGFEHKLHDPVLRRDGLRLAILDGEPVGFGIPWVLPHADSTWAMLRVAVLPRCRRQGIGRALLGSLLDFVATTWPGLPVDAAASAWLPNDAAEAFAAHLGWAYVRTFWLMERPRGGARPPEWPAGIEVRTFDGSDRAIREWTECYNDSFSEHFRFSAADVEDTRTRVADPTFRPDGLLLAYRGATCVGFCRNEVHDARGEIGVLGVVHAERGTGLGRALLRWGVGWLERETALPVTLIVDGENETALRLYRGEGFEVSRTRRSWGRLHPVRNG